MSNSSRAAGAEEQAWRDYLARCRKAYRDVEAGCITFSECFNIIDSGESQFPHDIVQFISNIASEMDTDRKMFHDVLRFLDTQPSLDQVQEYIDWFGKYYGAAGAEEQPWLDYLARCRKAYRDFDAGRITLDECFDAIDSGENRFPHEVIQFISNIASEVDTDRRMFHDVLRFLDKRPPLDKMQEYMDWFDKYYEA